MCSVCGRFSITYNGEIYNYRELKEQLKGLGFEFRTESDTEVVLNAYARWGEGCVGKFRGMFAFGIADKEKNTLFLARDHFGIKPLVYFSDPHNFAFASEIQALRALPWVDSKLAPNLGAINWYLRFGYISAPESGFSQISKLAPGSVLTVAFSGPTLEVSKPKRYWDCRISPEPAMPAEEWGRAFEAAIAESVEAHLISDVPFGAFLSGGLDSTLVSSIMAEKIGDRLQTFTIGVNADGFDERPYALEAAKKIGVEFIEEMVDLDALEILPELVRHYGEPFGDRSAVPTWYLARLARRHVPMVLSGDGADEILAGYHSYRAWREIVGRPISPPERTAWKQLLRPVLAGIFPRRFPPDERFVRSTADRWAHVVSFVPEEEVRSLWKEDFRSQFGGLPPAMERGFSLAGDDPVAQARGADLASYLPNDILTKIDISGMAHGLECRVPFVDVRIAELIRAMPTDAMMRHEPGYGWRGKLPIRSALKRRGFSAQFIDRNKQGFGIPLDQWLLGREGSLSEIRERLLDPGALVGEYFTGEGILRLIENKRGAGIWMLLFLEEWLKQSKQ